MPIYPNRTPFKRAVSGKITPKIAGDELDDTTIRDAADIINIPAGSIVSTDAQAAITELDADSTLLRNRATAIENDIDYPSSQKQKAIASTGEDGGVEGGIFNGDFEYGTTGNAKTTNNQEIGGSGAGWFTSAIVSAGSAELDTISYKGNKSIKLSTNDATGKSGATISDANNKFYPLIPSALYRLSMVIKTDNVATDAVYATIGEYDSDKASIGGTWSNNQTSKLSGNNDWTYIEKIFTTNANCQFINIFLYNDVAGNISDAWFDDIKLEQIDTQTVNTQTDEIVSVSVEGVTTTDNVDQSLNTSGQTYTLPTAVDEGATHRQTFTPTADRGDGKHLLTKIQVLVAAVGTGDWTMEVHDAANAILASQTIVVGSMTIGDVDFDVPAILDVGTVYHFHIYSTVADGTVTTTTLNDLETVDYHAQFAKHTESPIIESNGAKLDLTGVKLLTGATITINADGSGKYEWTPENYGAYIKDIYDAVVGNGIDFGLLSNSSYVLAVVNSGSYTVKFDTAFPVNDGVISYTVSCGAGRSMTISYSHDNIIWEDITSITDADDGDYHSHSFYEYVKLTHIGGSWCYLVGFKATADLDCQAVLPIFTPSSEVTTETEDFTLNPIDISEDGYWQLKSDLTGWGSRTITMLLDEATFESQVVSANTIYIYDSNSTTPWTWDERSGLVPPADRTAGTVTAKFLVGDNQIKSSVNDGSMKVNMNLSWTEESLRAAVNRLNALANLQYPIVVEVEDVPAIDVQDQPTGATAESGYTNDVTSLRQTTAGVAAIIYTGLLPNENKFSEWLDITVVGSDGDGTLQGKLYTVDGILIETYADLETNPVISISNPDYKYSRERLILQISASLETTSTAWSVTDIKWRYQYNG